MKRLSMLLNWQKLTVIGLAILAGGSVTAYEMNVAAERVDAAASTSKATAASEAARGKSASSEGKDAPSDRRQAGDESAGTAGLEECHNALKKTHEKLRRMSDYSASFRLRERVGGELTDEQQVVLRVRHQPFSVHMKWIDEGREAVYVEGRNDNKLVVKPGGLAALVGTVELDPEGETAMEEARHPITEAGMLALIEKLINYQKPLIKDGEGVRCEKKRERCEGEDCDCYVLSYADASVCDGYAKTTLHISRESGLLVSITNYGFDKSASSGTALIEHYVYTDVQPDVGFGDDDFQLAQSGLTGRIRTAVARKNSAE